ncbi:kappaPI-actitoxin-Avd3b-like [Hermetia illucens]|uniref:kappaPI-actitoxin-Avd3b-like n=1 Tax=Hermetia illucens TaxID=343691 RepID=UPI0018CC4F6C|nr:kappaPI-actitoxin-Avd3b-like [Hermetia illucens]
MWPFLFRYVVLFSVLIFLVASRPEWCDLDVDKGYGVLVQPRYFFSKKTKICHVFLYNGQGGNANNFHTFKQCMDTCWIAEK